MDVVRSVSVSCIIFLMSCTHHIGEESVLDPPAAPPPPAASPEVSQLYARQALLAEPSFYGPVLKNRENYQHTPENRVKRVLENPLSTFSVDVDTAAYSNIRRMVLQEGRLPPKDAVRIEEMVNYFDYDYQVPDSLEQPFSVVTEVAPAPWDSQLHLLRIGLKGYEPVTEQRPDANLVFLIDVSGSMQSQNKLPLVKQSLRLLTRQMRDNDRIAIVAYAGAVGVVLDSTTGDKKTEILRSLDKLRAGGSTHGSAGIHLAYEVAEKHLDKNGINRVIIASDGDMNVGVTDHDQLITLIEEKRQSGIALTTLGFGAGNYNDALMEQLADAGNGSAAYIDNLKEAKKVLVTEMDSTLLTIAQDVKIQVEFNPQYVAEYRLIGYENRLLQRDDFTNDKVDAGDIGAGHTVTALYELALAGSDAKRMEPLRYSSNKEVQIVESAGELAYVKLRYKQPGADESTQFSHVVETQSVVSAFTEASVDFKFASTVAGFGETLRGSDYGQLAMEQVLENLEGLRGEDEYGYRSEFKSLVELAMSIGS